jgi:integrase
MAHVEKRGEKRWRARYRGPDGRERSRTFERKVDADRWLDTIRGDLSRGDWIDPELARRTTVEALGQAWMRAQPWRASTRARQASMWRNHIEPTLGHMPIGAVRTSTVQALAKSLAADLADSTVASVIGLLSSVFAAAVQDGLVRANPVTAVKLPTKDGVMRVPLTAGQVDAIREAIDKRLELAVELGAATGLRQGEMFGLTWDRVVWLRRELRIDRQMVTSVGGKPSFGPVKTPRSVRTVPLTDELVERLSMARASAAGDLVFSIDGRPWRRNTAADTFRAAAAKAKVSARGWHDLRHYAASVLIREGLSVTAVAATLGHSPAECLKTYAGWWPSEDELVRAAMQRAAQRPAASPRPDETAQGV